MFLDGGAGDGAVAVVATETVFVVVVVIAFVVVVGGGVAIAVVVATVTTVIVFLLLFFSCCSYICYFLPIPSITSSFVLFVCSSWSTFLSPSFLRLPPSPAPSLRSIFPSPPVYLLFSLFLLLFFISSFLLIPSSSFLLHPLSPTPLFFSLLLPLFILFQHMLHFFSLIIIISIMPFARS